MAKVFPLKALSPVLLLGGRRNAKQKEKYDDAQQQLEEAGLNIVNPWEGMGDYWRCYTYTTSEYSEEERAKMEKFWRQKLTKIERLRALSFF